MVEVVYKRLQAGRSVARPDSVTPKRQIGADGKATLRFSVDANSSSFEDGITYVFRRSVKAAREDNLRRFGSPDRVSDRS